MTGAAEILRGAVAAVHAAFLGSAVDVTHEAYLGPEGDQVGVAGGYSAPVARKALVDLKAGTLPVAGGQEIRYRAKVSLVEVVDVGPRDRITVPGGLTGPLFIPAGGTLDPTTNQPYARTVFIR